MLRCVERARPLNNDDDKKKRFLGSRIKFWALESLSTTRSTVRKVLAANRLTVRKVLAANRFTVRKRLAALRVGVVDM